jgi:3-oxoadipate enol-lactonase
MFIKNNGLRLHVKVDGVDHPIAPPVLLLHALGTDLHIWDRVLALLPEHLRYVRFDQRGHGLSDAPPAPYNMGAMVSDAEAVLTALNVKDCLVVGLSMGGLVAQGLAVKRLDLVRAMVLLDTAPKIGVPAVWAERIAMVRDGGMQAIVDGAMERVFSRAFRATPELTHWRNMLLTMNPQGWMGCAAAISGTDFYTPTSGLRLPVLGLVGSEDATTPPDLMRETMDLIPGSKFRILRKCGHFPPVEDPIAVAEALIEFMTDVGHL